jgi:hypothetical protein
MTTARQLPSGATLISFDANPKDGTAIARGQNFIVEWIGRPGQTVAAESTEEMILLLADGDARVDDGTGAIALEGPSAAIAPPGRFAIELMSGGPLLVFATERSDHADGTSEPHDNRIAPLGAPFLRRRPLTRLEVASLDALANPSGNARIRFLQSATMSLNIVRYPGARDTTSLSPHAHKDIQQGTLAIAGHYVHHLRTPWTKDMADWREDEHVEAGPATLLLIPPEIVHTTQGVGEEAHLLVDIFAPPRRDFVAKGWMANAGDYCDPMSESASS